MKIKGIDHIVIPVSDIEKSLEFYCNVLGMEKDLSHGRCAVKFGNQKINLHRGAAEFLPAAENPVFGAADVCFLVEGNMDDIVYKFKGANLQVIEGPVRRLGACGAMKSVYVRDPDGNLIEISIKN